MRKVFFLTSGSPVPIAGARRIRDAQIITALAKKMDVEVLCIAPSDQAPSVQSKCEALFGPRVRVSCHPLDEPTLVSRALNLVKPDFAQGYSQSMEHYLRSRAQPGDLVWLSRLRMAKYITPARKLGCHTILDEHHVESDLMFDNAFTKVRYWHQGVTAAQCAFYEKKLCDEAEIVVTASNIDASRMQKLSPKSKIRIVPHAVRTSNYSVLPPRPRTQRPELLYFGDLDYRPNSHGVEWFLSEIYPRLRAATSGVPPHVVIASENECPPGWVDEMPPGLEYVRYSDTEHLLDLFARATAVFVPLRYGRGNRIQLLEAMAAGMPIVTTGKGADGLVLKPSYDICVAEEEDAFASTILRLVRDQEFRAALSLHAKETAAKLYDWQATESAVDQVLNDLGL